MKIFICASKHFYEKLPPIIEDLKKLGHKITLPNSFDDPFKEEEIKKQGKKKHAEWKSSKLKLQNKKVKNNDAILICNFKKHNHENYIGGATFLEMYKAWELNKKIFLLNPLPKCSFTDELNAMTPRIILGDLSKIK